MVDSMAINDYFKFYNSYNPLRGSGFTKLKPLDPTMVS